MIIKRPSRRGGLFDVKTLYSITVPKLHTYNPHLHNPVPNLRQKPEKSADRRVSQIVVPEHIPARGHLYAVAPLLYLAYSVGDREICSDILYLGILYPRLKHQLNR